MAQKKDMLYTYGNYCTSDNCKLDRIKSNYFSYINK